MNQAIRGPDGQLRCRWCLSAPQFLDYHDSEWGFPVDDDCRLFEKLSLEAFQSGLSWRTILAKRDNFRRAFCDFDPVRIARFDGTDVERLLGDRGIVRHRGKIEATIGNARAYLEIGGGEAFSTQMWAYVDGAPLVNRFQSLADVPASTPLSERISKDLRKAGFRFVGPTIVYAWMQACGLVNDHIVGCPARRV